MYGALGLCVVMISVFVNVLHCTAAALAFTSTDINQRFFSRRTGMRELWSAGHTAVEARRHRPLPLQRLRPLPQDERPEQTASEAEEATGRLHPYFRARSGTLGPHQARAPNQHQLTPLITYQQPPAVPFATRVSDMFDQ